MMLIFSAYFMDFSTGICLDWVPFDGKKLSGSIGFINALEEMRENRKIVFGMAMAADSSDKI